jgi:hypothetical protein
MKIRNGDNAMAQTSLGRVASIIHTAPTEPEIAKLFPSHWRRWNEDARKEPSAPPSTAQMTRKRPFRSVSTTLLLLCCLIGEWVAQGAADNSSLQHHRTLPGGGDEDRQHSNDANRQHYNSRQSYHATSYTQRHPNSYSNGYNSVYYNYNDDDSSGSVHHKRTKRQTREYTNLTDVELCLLTALAWTVMMIRSFLSSKKKSFDERFIEQKESMLLVRGHVLQVSRKNDDEVGVGEPKYTAVIDYVIEREQTHESIQIRKHFDTQQFLEQGFANVELLVLPEEPTHSILKEDFERKLHQEVLVQEYEKLKKQNNSNIIDTTYRSSGKQAADSSIYTDEFLLDSDPVAYLLEGRYCNRKCTRFSTGLAGALVLLSLAGTVQVVCLMDPATQWMGWVLLCVGVALMLPLSILANKCIHATTKLQESSEKQGYVVQSYTATGNTLSSVAAPPLTVMTPEDDFLSTACLPPNCCGMDKHSAAEVASYVVPEVSGCYFVHYNNNEKRNRKSARPPVKARFVTTKEVRNVANSATAAQNKEIEDAAGEVSSTSTVSSISNDDSNDGMWTNLPPKDSSGSVRLLLSD